MTETTTHPSTIEACDAGPAWANTVDVEIARNGAVYFEVDAADRPPVGRVFRRTQVERTATGYRRVHYRVTGYGNVFTWRMQVVRLTTDNDLTFGDFTPVGSQLVERVRCYVEEVQS